VAPTLDEANMVDSPRIISGRTVLLECPLSGGVPAPRVTWLKNGSPIQFSDSRRVRRLGSGRGIQIMRARAEDTARYTCIATNDAGEVRRHFDLEVLGMCHVIVVVVVVVVVVVESVSE